MDLIRENTIGEKAVMAGLLLVGAAIAFFAFYGFYQMAWKVPERVSIEGRAEAWEVRAMELEKVVTEYQSALKFENLFLLIANPNAVMDFGELEKIIQDKREFYEVRK